jgi:hypothetical protein
MTFNYQSARPGGVVEQKRLVDCEALLSHMHTIEGQSVRELARELGWSWYRVREALKAMRSEVERVDGLWWLKK